MKSIDLEPGKCFVLMLSVFIGIASGLILFSSKDARGSEKRFKVTSVNSTAWVMPAESTVKQSIAKGHLLSADDTLEVMDRHSALISLDNTGDNLLHVSGGTVMRIAPGHSTQVIVDRGEVIACLNRPYTLGGFNIQTPHSSSVAKGTYFKVASNSAQSTITVYKGLVHVYGKNIDGSTTPNRVVLTPAYSTTVTAEKRTPHEAKAVTQQVFDEINGLIWMLPDGFSDLLEFDEHVIPAQGQRLPPAGVSLSMDDTPGDGSKKVLY